MTIPASSGIQPAQGEGLAGRLPELPEDLFDLLPVGVWVCDRYGHVVRYNREAARLWGHAPARGDPDLLYCGAERLFHPDLTPLPHAESPMARVLATGEQVRDQAMVIGRPDGSRIATRADFAPVRDDAGRMTGAIGVLREAPAPEGRQTPSPDGADLLGPVLQALPAAVYITDADGRITFYNDEAAALWGVRPEPGSDSFCGSWRLEWPDGTPLPHAECPMALALREKRPIHGMEAVAVRPDGSRVPFLAVPTPLFDAAGRLTGAVNMLVDLSERNAARDRIRASEARYSDIFDSVAVGLLVQDFRGVVELLDALRAEGVTDLRAALAARPKLLARAVASIGITDVNPYACRLFEAETPQDLVQSPGAIWLPETTGAVVDVMVALWEGRPDNAGEAAVQTLRGRRLDVAYTVVFEGARGERALVSLLDISDRKTAQRLIEKQASRLETLNRVARAIGSDLDLERIVQTLTNAATDVAGARFGAFFYNSADQGSEGYTLFALSGAPRAAFEGLGVPRNTALFDSTFRGMGIIRSDDIRTDPRYGRQGPHFGMPPGHLPVVSYLAVPVVSRTGKVHGGLFLGHDQPGMFAQDTEEMVAAIAAHAAIALDNAQLLQSTRDEVERRRRSDHAAQHLAAIVASSDDAILSKDLNGVITSWNAGAQRIFGYTAEEVIGKPVTILIPEDRQDEEPRILARIRGGERVDHYETVRRRRDGSLFHVSLTVSPVKNNEGFIVGASKIARDITEKKQAEERLRLLLREMDHRVKNLFALSNSVVALSARSATSVRELAQAVQNRLHALAHAHTLTLPQTPEDANPARKTTSLHALIQTIVAPFDVRSDENVPRIVTDGCDLAIGGAGVSGFALLLHELATNAAKHGALSTPSGQVAIRCSEADGRFWLVWEERGGPPIEGEAVGEGFGSLLSRAVVEGQLRGQLERVWQREGLTLRIAVPRERVAAT